MSQQTSQNVPCSLYCPYSVSTVAFFSLFRTRYGFFILVFLLVAIIYSILNVSLISSFWIDDVDFREELIPLESGNFWVNRDKDKGLIDPDSLEGLQDNTLLSYRSLELQQECNNFFTVWPGDCIDKFIQLDSRIRTLSALMVVMNSTLFFYTTDNRGCAFSSYPGIRVKRFNATDLLLSHGFVKALPIINSWDKSRFTRISDVLRICLALTYKLSYLDTDVHFLQPNKEWFLRSYVGALVWSER